MSRRQRHLGYGLATAGVICIALLTLFPHPEQAARAASTPPYCVVCGELGGVDFLLNILLFMPLGFGLALAGFSWRRAVVLAGLLSFGVELLQMKVIAGRDASLGDLLTNTLGGGIGALLGAHWRRVAGPPPRLARRLALVWALALVWVWAGTAWALGPAWPTEAPWFGQWAADLGYMQPFLGTPLVISAGGEPLLPGRALDDGRLKDAVASNPAMAFRAVLGPPTTGLAPVASIFDGWQREAMLLGQNRHDLQFRIRMRSGGLRLRNPIIALPMGMAGHPGDTVEAEAALRGGVFALSARNGNQVRAKQLPLSASWGWTLVLPWNYGLGTGAQALTGLWIGGLLGLLTYWTVFAGGRTVGLVPVTAAILLGGVPYAAGFPPAHWSEWVAALVGVALGALSATAARRITRREDVRDES